MSLCAERTNNKNLGPKPLRRFITREIAISPLENIHKKSRIGASFFCVYSQFTPREKYLHPSCVAVLLVCRYFSFLGISVLCCWFGPIFPKTVYLLSLNVFVLLFVYMLIYDITYIYVCMQNFEPFLI